MTPCDNQGYSKNEHNEHKELKKPTEKKSLKLKTWNLKINIK